MNENIDLSIILKNCPSGTIFYSPIFGNVKFIRVIPQETFCIECLVNYNQKIPEVRTFTKEGCYTSYSDAECVLFPSKKQRDWLLVSWKCNYNLKPFDKVLVRDFNDDCWSCSFFSYFDDSDVIDLDPGPFCCINDVRYLQCIPYNEKTQHLIGTCQLPPEFYNINTNK